MDYGVGQCIDQDDNQPFRVAKSNCYETEWSTKCTSTHTTAKVRDAISAEILYHSDTNGQWRPEKTEVRFLSKRSAEADLMIPLVACLCRLQAKGLPDRQ